MPTGNVPFATATTAGTGCSGNATTFTITIKPTPPTITAEGTLDALTTTQGNPSVTTSFTVSGIKMQEGILVTPPPGFEVSTDGINFSSTVVVGAAGTIDKTKVYVRLSGSDAVGDYSGDITLSSLNADNVTVPTALSHVIAPTSTIAVGSVTGTILSCAGTPSSTTQQFSVSGLLISGGINVKAPNGFEVSLNQDAGYSGSLLINGSGTINSTTVYVRSSASASGIITGSVSVSSSGATTRNVAVKGNIGILPTVDKVNDQQVPGGSATAAVNFTGTGNTYTWVNDNTGIGLAASGVGNIPSFTAVNNGGTTVVAHITVTPQVAALAYIANQTSNSVSVVNTQSGDVKTIPVGQTPTAVTFSPDGKFIYIVNQTSGTISVIATSTNTVVASPAVGTKPSGVVITPDGSYLYTANSGSNDVSVIRTADNKVIATIRVGIGPEGIAISPDGKLVYVANRNAIPASISVIDTKTNTEIKKITGVGASPEGVTVSPDGSTLYVANYNSKSVSVINAATGASVAVITVGTSPRGIILNADGSRLYVSNSGSNTVSVINTLTNSVIASIDVGKSPEGISLNPDGTLAFVANANSNSITVFSTVTNAVTSTIPVGGTPVSFGNFITGGAGCTGTPTTFKITVVPSSPYITATGTLSGLTTTYGTPSASTSFSVTGAGMTTGITVIPPPGFEVSADNKTFSSTITVGTVSGTKDIAATMVYIRLAAGTPAGGYAGNIILSSTGAANTLVLCPTAK